MIIDKLYDNVSKKGLVCLGLDIDLSYIPKSFLANYSSVGDALFFFNKKIIDATINDVACYKPQIAYYEAHGLGGLIAYSKTLKYIKSLGGLTIGDIKRSDIVRTAQMYAKAHFSGEFEADFITLSPYLGLDSLEPYLPYVEKNEKGIFVLILTSNPGAKDIECINTSDNSFVYKKVGEKINTLGKKYLGNCGYSSIGGVVGCTNAESGEDLCKQLDSTFMLIPGYGAQGGTAKDIALYLKSGNGGVVNSSRSIILAYKKQNETSSEYAEKHFEEFAQKEVLKMKSDIAKELENQK